MNLRERRAERTLSPSLPTLETDDGRSAFLLDAEGTLRAFRMDDGVLRWSAKPPAICASLGVDEDAAYCVMEHAVMAYPKSGAPNKELYRTGAAVRRIAIGKSSIAIAESDGRLTLVDRMSGRATSAVIRAACSSCDLLQFRPDGESICVSDCAGTACYDAKLAAQWSLPRHVDEVPRVATLNELLLVAYRVEPGKSKDTVVTPLTTRIVRFGDGSISYEGNEQVVAFFEKPNGELDGVVSTRGLLEPDGRLRWSFQLDFSWFYAPPSVTAVQADPWLVFSDVSTRVFGINPTKRTTWSARFPDDEAYQALGQTGDTVDQIVRFDVRDATVVIEARTSSTSSSLARRFGAIFDVATGVRTYLDVPR